MSTPKIEEVNKKIYIKNENELFLYEYSSNVNREYSIARLLYGEAEKNIIRNIKAEDPALAYSFYRLISIKPLKEPVIVLNIFRRDTHKYYEYDLFVYFTKKWYVMHLW